MATYLEQMKERFGSKEALVNQLAPKLEREDDESKEGHRRRLMRVSNRKLLRLWAQQEAVGALGGRDTLARKVTELQYQGNCPEGPLARNQARPMGYLLDRYQSLSRG